MSYTTGFPPAPPYPYAYDSDRTLYLVYNTTESPLASNNEAWSEDVFIQPPPAGHPEVWASNGFGNLDGELFYYDAVDYNADGYVVTLRRCVRNLGGTHTHYNLAGTMVRGFVIAEHHNQLAEAIFRIENFVGINFSTDQSTLDWRIRNLQEVPIIFDDFDCPDVNFTFDVVSSDPSSGTVANYNLNVAGNFTSFNLSFGDGTSTTSLANGTHVYAPNATIDPVVSFSNSQCTVIQSPIARTVANVPQPPANQQILNIPIPTFPTLGDISLPSIPTPSLDFLIPPIVFPCLDVSPFPSTFFGPISIGIGGLSLPSQIEITPVNIPSIIMFTPVISFPSLIQFSPINVPSAISISPINVPSTISISPITIPSTISFSPISIPSNITFTPPPPFSPIDWGPTPVIQIQPAPCVQVCWGPVPTVPVNVAFTCNCACCPSSPSTTGGGGGSSPIIIPLMAEPIDRFNPFASSGTWMDPNQGMEMNLDFQGFPSVITILPPDIPDVQLVHNLPEKITLEMPSHTLIEYAGPPIPSIIELVHPVKPMELKIDVPKSISVEGMPTNIQLLPPLSMPVLQVDFTGMPQTIQVVGIPSVLEVIHNLPTGIDLVMPANPTVQMLPPTIPMSVVVTLDVVQQKIADAIKNQSKCVMIVPCE